jgi:hypothetical protein
MSNPGPNIVTPSIQRGASVVSIPSPTLSAIVGTSYSRVTVPGVQLGDVVTVSPNVAPAVGVSIANAFVDSADSVTLVYVNTTAGALSIASDIYNAYIVRGYPVVYDFGVTIFNNSGVVAGTNP